MKCDGLIYFSFLDRWIKICPPHNPPRYAKQASRTCRGGPSKGSPGGLPSSSTHSADTNSRREQKSSARNPATSERLLRAGTIISFFRGTHPSGTACTGPKSSRPIGAGGKIRSRHHLFSKREAWKPQINAKSGEHCRWKHP